MSENHRRRPPRQALRLLLSQFEGPIILILLFAAVLSAWTPRSSINHEN